MATNATRQAARALKQFADDTPGLAEAIDRLLTAIGDEPHGTWWETPDGMDHDSFDDAVEWARTHDLETVCERVGDDNGAFELYDATYSLAEEDWVG